MGESPLMVGISGLRGIVGESLTPEVATRFGRAFGDWLVARCGGAPVVVLGADGRVGYEAIVSAASAGLIAAGCVVEALGVVATPTVGVHADAIGAAGGMVVTASHNPQQWNGLKCLVREMGAEAGHPSASAPEAGDAHAIIERFEAMGDGYAKGIGSEQSHRKRRSLGDTDSGATGGLSASESVCVNPGTGRQAASGTGDGMLWLAKEGDGRATAGHVARVLDALDRVVGGAAGARGHAVALDSVNASGRIGARALLENELGCALTAVGDEATGVFPHAPEPTRENLSGAGGLSDAVREAEAAVGFAQDPDADRLAVLDEAGGYIGEEYTLALTGLSVLSAMGEAARGAVVVTNLSTSRMIEDVAAAFGATVERTPVGEAHVVAAMRRLASQGKRVVLGGEGNGGVIWPEVTFVRDALGAMGLVLALMGREGATVSALVAKINAMSIGGNGYAIEKRKVAIGSRAEATPAVEAIAAAYSGERVDRQDGCRVDWADRWLHVRASNTEPILRLIAEAPTEEMARAMLDEAGGIVGRS